MQTFFLTSAFPNGFPEAFVQELKAAIPQLNNFVFVASAFDEAEKTEKYAKAILTLFHEADLDFKTLTLLDDRLSESQIDQCLKQVDVIWLAGGDTLRQHASFERIGLREKLKTTNAVIIGMSAGAINMGDHVVLAKQESDHIPQLSEYRGLGLTKINLEPHYDASNIEHKEEIRQASRIAPILALCDNAFVKVKGQQIQIYGEYTVFDPMEK
ncbi:Type 1 glutamine amidotransferase-like domain-containing protein [Holdemania massiliensis]|uniref:Type 1 glutamine amidotransferase-like domain-containing protein n=1 Tax=Holdemania massiliensis TaxID=1468449 RepID=UPI001F05E09E|nr:Type 1 glutamine amidotransferase-like domain-containing protein [Holdemania massiliensis]MCH1942393.1 Type 1 glutamine amidotransferase-like domain-containing protein [Holdemania massiliensis]